MRFLIAVIDRESNLASESEMAQIDEFNEKLVSGKNLILACGLASPAKSRLIDNRENAGISEARSIFTSTEYMSGFWMIEVENPEEAESIAKSASKACNRVVELRPLLGS